MLDAAQSRFCCAIWFALGFIGNLSFRGTRTDTKVDYACCNDTTFGCINFNLTCPKGQRIQLIDVKYNLKQSSDSSDLVSQCSADTNASECFGRGSQQCCAGGNHTLHEYKPTHKYNLFKKCSWQPTCTPRAEYWIDTSQACDYCVISYQCAEERRVTFCEASNVTGNNTNILYNSSNPTGSDVSCWCAIHPTGNFTIKAQDFRFHDENGNCIDGVTLHVYFQNRDDLHIINCSSSKVMGFQTVNTSDYIEFELTVPANKTPQMIWITAEALDHASLSARCFRKNDIPIPLPATSSTTLSPVTTVDSVSIFNPSSSLTLTSANITTSETSSETPVAISESVVSTPVTGTTDNGTLNTNKNTQGSGFTHDRQTVHAPSSGGVSMVAIVTPVVSLVVIGTGVAFVAIVFWRKRRTMNDKLDGTNDNNYYNAEKMPSEPQRSNYDNTVLPNTPIKTSDNYIVLDSESNYNYIDHKDAQKSVSYQDVSISSSFPSQMHKPDVSNYSAFGLQDSNAGNNVGSNTKDAQSGQMIAGNPNYFVLEGSGSSLVGRKESLSALQQRSERTDVEITSNSSKEENHSYFTLEPQKGSGDYLEPHKVSRADHVASHNVATTANNYFVLEPQDTYSIIDPNDVVVQTLPDDEYNVLNVKLQGTEKDLNYTGLKPHHMANKAQESGDYSHIGSSAVGNKYRLQEYSHMYLDSAHAEKNEPSGNNEYSHLGSVVTNQSSQSAEGNEYAHLQRTVP